MEAAIAQMLTTAQVTGINAEREYEFPGLSLEFFEKTPDGDTQLSRISTDWCARRIPSDGLTSNIWEFEIIDSGAITPAVANKTAYMVIGTLRFKGVKRDTKASTLGVWKFVTEMI